MDGRPVSLTFLLPLSSSYRGLVETMPQRMWTSPETRAMEERHKVEEEEREANEKKFEEIREKFNVVFKAVFDEAQEKNLGNARIRVLKAWETGIIRFFGLRSCEELDKTLLQSWAVEDVLTTIRQLPDAIKGRRPIMNLDNELFEFYQPESIHKRFYEKLANWRKLVNFFGQNSSVKPSNCLSSDRSRSTSYGIFLFGTEPGMKCGRPCFACPFPFAG
ncbi:uncharacterized protein JCM6883_005077 [Sporobolomyces salmoneus]|uniref:uncharacterized protein n=1 Tax=Sporobolomyces salmoneus TaxID=183962 RepID=UPI003175AF26